MTDQEKSAAGPSSQAGITVSLEWAKKLKESGYPQDVPEEFGDEQSRWWCQYDDDEPTLLWLQSDGFNDNDTHGEDEECKVLYKSPFAEEILRRLPWKIQNDGNAFFLRVEPYNDSLDVLSWRVVYPNLHSFTNIDKSLANAAAAMWCYLKENDLISPKP